jgi:hypothetical protein
MLRYLVWVYEQPSAGLSAAVRPLWLIEDSVDPVVGAVATYYACMCVCTSCDVILGTRIQSFMSLRKGQLILLTSVEVTKGTGIVRGTGIGVGDGRRQDNTNVMTYTYLGKEA